MFYIGTPNDQQKSPYYGDYMTPLQSKMARAALGWGVLELAKQANVSTQTIVRFERGDQLRAQTIELLRCTFEAAGIELIAENGGGVGVRLKK
jgi:DNA-binding XRE family transcriptional regulator